MENQTTNQSKRCLKVKEVAHILSMGESTVWLKAKKDEHFPKPFSMGERATFWLESEVHDYIDKMLNKARSPKSIKH